MPPRESDLWELAQSKIKTILDEHSFKNWFSQTRLESCEDGCMIIGAPSQFFADWLRDHYLDTVSQCAREVVPEFREIRFVVTTDGSAFAPSAPGARESVAPTAPKRKPLRLDPKFEGFNPRYTFDRFVVGSGNRFAHAAAKAVADSPARAYNPLFLYGGTGLGKTHLMQAIGQEILERNPNANIEFVSSEHFTNQLIESIAKKSTQRFRAKYRKVDVLLIDDIHFIAGKEATQEEFFHTFNSLFDMHKQIVLSSDRGPKEIQGLEERLVSRFEWGLVTDIQPPDVETRMAILQNRAAVETQVVPQDVIRYIANAITTNIRELEGALITVLAYSKLTERKITIDVVDEVLRDLIGRDKLKVVTVEAIQRAVAEYFDVRIADLRGRSRQRQVAYPRQIAMYLCKTMMSNLSLNEVGEAFGGKDHTTVLYACQKIGKEAQGNTETKSTVARLEKTIRS